MKLRLCHPRVGEIAFPVPDGAQIVLGRRGGSTGIELNWDAKISRRHARVWVEHGRLWIEDLGSRNGTWHQGTRLTGPFRIEPGDRVRVGETGLENADTPVVEILPSMETIPANVSLADLGFLPDLIQDDTGSLSLAELADELEMGLAEALEGPYDTAEVEAPLPSQSALAPSAAPQSPPPPQVDLVDGIVQVTLEDREALEHFLNCDLTKTGVFVPTSEPPAFGTELAVEIATPDGTLKLVANVVHVVDATMAAQIGSPCGAGLQVVDIDAETRSRVQAYLKGQRRFLTGETEVIDESRGDVAISISKQLIARVEHGDLYRAIELSPDALQSEVDARLGEIATRLSGVTGDLPPPQAARLPPARKCLAQVVETLSTPERRLQYDFTHGHVKAEARLKAAADRTGPSVAVLRRAWRICHPRKVEQSQQLLRRAFEMRRARSFEEAITLGREALGKDPFWLELRRTVETWEALYEHDQSPA